MNLLILTADPPSAVGGIEGRAIAYKSELSSMGHSVTLVSLTREASDGRVQYPEDFRLSSNPIFVVSTLVSLKRIIEEKKIRNIFFLSGGSTVIGVAVLLYSRIIRLRTAQLFYGKDIKQVKRSMVSSILLRISVALTDSIAVNSLFTAKLFRTINRSAKKIVILYPGVYTSYDHGKGDSISAGPPSLLFVGRLIRRKGLEYLIKAIVLLRNEFPDIKLVIVGSGPEHDDVNRLITQLGLTKNVELVGELRGKELSERYDASQIFAMPSITLDDDVEGFGTVFLEAGLHGLPSVSTFSGGIPEAVINGITGILVPEKDVVQLSNAIRTLLVDHEKRKMMGKAARSRAVMQFSWKLSAQKLLSLFE